MKANYDGLEYLLKANNMSKTSLLRKAGLPTSVLTAVAHKKPLPMPSALVLCKYFLCDISDIMTLVYEEDDLVEFELSVFTEMIADARCRDVTVNHDGHMFVFHYHAPDGSTALLMSVSYDGFPMGRAEMKSDTESIMQVVIKEAERKRQKYAVK